MNRNFLSGILIISLFVLAVSCIHDKPGSNHGKAVTLNDSAVNLIMAKGHDSLTMSKAIYLLNQAIITDSTFVKAYTNKLYFERLQKHFDQALTTAVKLCQINPNDPSNYLTAGILSEKTGDTATAQGYYRKASVLFSNKMDTLVMENERNFDPLVEKAICLILQGKTNEGNLAVKLALSNKGASDHQKMVLDGYSTLSRSELFEQWLYGNPMQTFSRK
jgi:tetratricopeptide (TPR) repeat protein